MKSFNQLSPAEAERLAYLLEELGEAQQAIGKILRHGYESTNPDSIDNNTNRDNLEKELGDIICAIYLISEDVDLDYILSKRPGEKLYKYLHHQWMTSARFAKATEIEP